MGVLRSQLFLFQQLIKVLETAGCLQHTISFQLLGWKAGNASGFAPSMMSISLLP